MLSKVGNLWKEAEFTASFHSRPLSTSHVICLSQSDRSGVERGKSYWLRQITSEVVRGREWKDAARGVERGQKRPLLPLGLFPLSASFHSPPLSTPNFNLAKLIDR